jgi:hypothetical protein
LCFIGQLADGQSFTRLGQFGMACFFIFAGCQASRSSLMHGDDRLVLLDGRFQEREILSHACRQCSGEPLASAARSIPYALRKVLSCSCVDADTTKVIIAIPTAIGSRLNARWSTICGAAI